MLDKSGIPIDKVEVAKCFVEAVMHKEWVEFKATGKDSEASLKMMPIFEKVYNESFQGKEPLRHFALFIGLAIGMLAEIIDVHVISVTDLNDLSKSN